MVNNLFAQSQATHNNYFTIPEIALIDIEPNTSDIELKFDSPKEPGDKLKSVQGKTKWINYTSTQSITGTYKVITAQISKETTIPGLSITLAISSYQGRGEGDLGSSVGKINLSTTAQTIISGIGGCYTESGKNNGHEIEYYAQITDYSVFEIPKNTSMDIIFTITN
jgi:hypothetical protein